MRQEPKKLIILGAGGHARVVIAGLKAAGIIVSKCTALEPPNSLWPASIQWLGGDAALADLDPSEILLVNGLGSVKADRKRSSLFERARAAGFAFASLKHPTAFVDETVLQGEGAQIMAGAVVQAGVIIGHNVIVNTGAVVDHDCRIGDHVHIAPGACLSGAVTVEVDAHVGAGAVVIQNVTIGAGATVGAGSVVLRNVTAGAVVCGVPAREIRSNTKQ